jgi:hypothetical protein
MDAPDRSTLPPMEKKRASNRKGASMTATLGCWTDNRPTVVLFTPRGWLGWREIRLM